MPPIPMNTCIKISALACLCFALQMLSACATIDRDHAMVISVPDQEMLVLERGQPIARFPVSTSKYGLGDSPNSFATPVGRMRVAKKIGDGAPLGAVFKDRKLTGEVLPVNAPGRDPIVTRILWLQGSESQNARAFSRYIYIHGTPEERNIGRPASYGCIRMRSKDVVALFDTVGVGAEVIVSEMPMRDILRRAAEVAQVGG